MNRTPSTRGLAGRTVVVTRDEHEDGPLCERLRRHGCIPMLRPTLSFRLEGAGSELDDLAGDMSRYDWLIITSGRAATALGKLGALRGRKPEGLRIAAVGPGTANALSVWGWTASIVPLSGGGTALAELLHPRITEGERVLYPASAASSQELPEALEAMGAEVVTVVAYSPVPLPQDTERWEMDLATRHPDVLTFTSPSALEALAALPASLLEALRRIPAATQGPTTTAAVRDAGWPTVIEAEPTTFDGLISSLARYFDA